MHAPAPRSHPHPSLSHFVIFNPTLASRPPKQDNHDAVTTATQEQRQLRPSAVGGSLSPPATTSTDDATKQERDRDRDLEEDLREAAQIVFYTSRESGGVSRDKMLRQVGLAKGLMGFADMVVVDTSSGPGSDSEDQEPVYWAVASQYQRLLVYAPEPNWFIYISISLPREIKEKDATQPQGKPAKPETPPPALSDAMLVEGLRRGYADFCLLHADLDSHLPPTPAFASLLERYWTRFAFAYEAAYLTPGPLSPLLTWLGGYPSDVRDEKLRDALNALLDGHEGAGAGLVAPKRPLMASGVPGGCEGAALTRFLLALLSTSLPPPSAALPKPDRERHSLGFLRRKKPPLGLSPSSIPGGKPPAATAKGKDLLAPGPDSRKGSWGLASPLSWVGFASAPASRSATPVNAPTPTPTVGPSTDLGAATIAAASAKAEESTEEAKETSAESTASPPRPVGATHKPRWPSLGISFGDAVGNVSSVFGLGSSPKPGSSHAGGVSPTTPGPEDKAGETEVPVAQQSQVDEAEEGMTKEDKEEEEEEEDKEEKEDKEREEETNHEAAEEPLSLEDSEESKLEPAEERGTTATEQAADLPVDVPEDASPSIATPPDVVPDEAKEASSSTASPPETTARDATEPAQGSTTTTAPDAELRSGTPYAPSIADDDAASVAISLDLDAAVHSDVDMAWESRAVHLSGARRRLFWVIRERKLLFFLAPRAPSDDPDPERHDLPPATAALHVFAAHSSATASETDSKDKERERRDSRQADDTTVYHAANDTEVTGTLDSTDSGTLAALRGILMGGVGMVFAQTPSGKFAVAKTGERGEKEEGREVERGEEEEKGQKSHRGEMFAITARKDSSLTDAERVVREFARTRPEWT